MDTKCKDLTIFEGVDGSGKTTAARKFAELTGARYVHLPAFPRVGKNLARMYVEAMLPALLGYQDVVMDRCWLSEAPYGSVFRDGQDRLTMASRAMLERIACKCRPFLVYCDPGLNQSSENFSKRKGGGGEMLKSVSQLSRVYAAYNAQETSLPAMWYNYSSNSVEKIEEVASRSRRAFESHYVNGETAGNLKAKVVIIGDEYSERKDCDAFYQAPFVSFSSQGCSQWLTNQVIESQIGESNLLWMNSEAVERKASSLVGKTAICLGDQACSVINAVQALELDRCHVIQHPQYHKRFRKGDYELVDLLKNLHSEL